MWHKENHLPEIPAHVAATRCWGKHLILILDGGSCTRTHHPICVVHAATCESCHPPPHTHKKGEKKAAVVEQCP